MNWLPEWLVDSTGKLRLGNWAKDCVDWLTANADWFFDWLSAVLSAVINAMLFVLQWPNAFVLIALLTGLAWLLRRSLGIATLTAIGLMLIDNQGYWKETTEPLALVLAATAVCMLVGVPVVRALNTVNIARGFDAGFCIVVLAIILDRMFRTAEPGSKS